MSYWLPRAASTPLPATRPPQGLDGHDFSTSVLVTVVETPLAGESSTHDPSSASSNTWHLLDNGASLAEAGLEPTATILCVHGNPTWSYLWRSLVSSATAAALDGGEVWRVIAVDQLEMGFSERTGRRRPLARRVRDLTDLTDALGLTGPSSSGAPVITFGHDWGGVVSLGWAVDHPEVLAASMLLNTAVHQPEADPIPAPLRLALARSVLGAATVSTPAFLETTLSLAHPPLRASVRDGYRAPYRTAERRGGIGGFVADIPVDESHESWSELERISSGVRELTVPALMLWGPRDPIFSDRYLDDLVDRLPHADVHRFEGAGHLVAEDVDFAQAALTWLGDRFGRADAAPDAPSSEESSAPASSEVSSEASPEASTPAEQPVAPSPRLWHHLEQLRDSTDTALVEMAPSGGSEPRVVSWSLLSRRVHEIAAGLWKSGVRPGQRVSLLVPPGADLTAILYACLRIGAVVVVADAGLGLAGLTRAVRGTWPDHVIGARPGLAVARALGWPGRRISSARLSPVLARTLGVSTSIPELAALGRAGGPDLPEPPPAEAVAAVLFTSGSTGPAKGVVYTHAQLSAVRDALSAQYGVGVGTGLVAGFAPFALLGPALGARSVTPDMNVTSPRTLTATAVADAASAVDATVVFLSPAALANVVATSAELSPSQRSALAGVETFLSAGAPVSEALLGEAARLMPAASAHTPYGMTEGLLMADVSLDEIRAASADSAGAGVLVGRSTATTRIRISALDESGRAVGALSEAPGVTGEIVVSAPHVEDHYDRLWLTDRGSRRGGVAGERWHRTGDVGHIDADGRLWVEGRLPHVIVTAHGVVTPVGPEQAIESVAAVSRAALVAVGPVGTQLAVAVVELTAGARRVSLADPALAAAVRAAAAPPIAAVLVVPRLPTDIRHNSKIDRSALGRWAEKILAGGRMVAP